MEESIQKFVEVLFAAQKRAHILHLKARSFAVHMALGELYTGLVEMIDEFVETAQGHYGILELENFEAEIDKTNDAMFLHNVCETLTMIKDEAAAADNKHSNLIADMETIISFVARIKYKIDNLGGN